MTLRAAMAARRVLPSRCFWKSLSPSNSECRLRNALKILLIVLLLNLFWKLYLNKIRLQMLFHQFYSPPIYLINFTSSFNFFFIGQELVRQEHTISLTKYDECSNLTACLNRLSAICCSSMNPPSFVLHLQ
jgi:hypothetical protein